MRYLIFVILCILLILTACQPLDQSVPPKYTANQITTKAQEQWRGFSYSKQEFANNVNAEASYLGSGVWKVRISVPEGYVLAGISGTPTSKVMYFHERTGTFSTRIDKPDWR